MALARSLQESAARRQERRPRFSRVHSRRIPGASRDIVAAVRARLTPRRIVRGAVDRSRRSLRNAYAARVPVERVWQRALPLEVKFWDDYLSRHGGDWPDEYSRRVD